MNISKLLITGVMLSAVMLSGCSGMTHREKGTAAGAAVGGVAGHLLCGGLLCTGAGAVVGGAIGHEVSKDKDNDKK